MNTVQQRLAAHYANHSKHSNYQVLPRILRDLLSDDAIETKTRHEVERLEYMLAKVDVSGKRALDIGGNTGYFTFELLQAGAASVDYYEGNKEHAEFVALAAEAVQLQDRLTVHNEYFPFDGSHTDTYDVTLLLNVLHHVGDDYGDKAQTIERARRNIVEQLNSMAPLTEYLVFQLGFNWQGNPEKGLFANGTKREMIDFVTEAVRGAWDISAVGVPQKVDGTIAYADLDDANIERDDTLGEFLNRPLFILKRS